MHIASIRWPLAAALVACATLLFSPQTLAQGREEARLLVATQVLEELRASRDQFIPDRLLERAYGIAVIPEVVKAGFIVGGRSGRGVLVVRDKAGRFTNPVFIRLAGGSFGWQAGVQETDIVLVFTTRRGIEGISDGKLTLGADASVAAGPVGRQASAATDATFSSEVYSYSRSRGLFAGVALDGSAITIDSKANANFYRKPRVAASDIISGSVTSASEITPRFLRAISASTGAEASQSQAAAGGASVAASGDTAAVPASPAPAPATRTFPMEDPAPGQNPPE